MFKIECGIPVPPVHRKWPFNDMKVGDSFLIPKAQVALWGGNDVAAHRAQGACAKRSGLKAATRIVKDGLRVWRVS